MAREYWKLAVLCLGGLLVLGVAGPALAGDSPTLVFPGEEVQRVQPGGTVDVDVVVQSDGGVDDAGVASISLVAGYETEHLEVVDVQAHSWLEGGEPTDVYTETELRPAESNISVDQWRDPERGGTTGNATFATITFAVDSDAPETNTTVSFQHSEVGLVQDYFVYVYGTNATIVIDSEAPASATDETADDHSDSDEQTDSQSDNGVPSRVFALGAALSALFLVSAAVWRKRR